MRKIILGVLLIGGFAIAYNDQCPFCSDCTQWEFRGAMKGLKARENFWRIEESVCEKHKQCIKFSAPASRIDAYCEKLENADPAILAISADENSDVNLKRDMRKVHKGSILNIVRRLSVRR